jgi:hypothetical protein
MWYFESTKRETPAVRPVVLPAVLPSVRPVEIPAVTPAIDGDNFYDDVFYRENLKRTGGNNLNEIDDYIEKDFADIVSA